MSAAIVQTRRFARQFKSLPADAAAEVSQAVQRVVKNPEAGALQKVDLAALRVFRFELSGRPYLLGYTQGAALRLIHLDADVLRAGSN